MHRLEEFEAIDDVHDVEELREKVRRAAAIARAAMEEREMWQRRYEDATADLVSIPEMSLDDLAKIVTNRDKHGQSAKNGKADS